MISDLGAYFEILTDWGGPFYFTLMFMTFLGMVVYNIFRTVIAPRNLAHKKEKEALLALFAELDPDPLIRFDREGKVLISNQSAIKLYGTFFEDNRVQQLIRNYKIVPEEIIDNNTSAVFKEKVNERIFNVTIKPMLSLDAAQLYFNDITEIENKESELIRTQKNLKEYSQNLQNYIEEEKFRIAGDLHDSIGQKLALLRTKLEKIGTGWNGIRDAQNAVADTIIELRVIMYDLKPKALEELGLAAALNSLVENTAKESGIAGKFELIGKNERFDKKTELCIFRIAQESVTNVVKHSEATVFHVQLVNTSGCLKLIVSDNGKGFNSDELFVSSSRNGFGLTNIKEKAENNFGIFKISSTPGEGTVLVVNLTKVKTDG